MSVSRRTFLELAPAAQQLTDATVIALAQNPAYAIVGNAAILRTPRLFEDLRAIGSTLSAEYILVAQVQEPPTGLIVRAHFIRAIDQTHLWAKGITAPAGQLEPQVVQTIAVGIDASLRSDRPPQVLPPDAARVHTRADADERFSVAAPSTSRNSNG